MAHSDNKRPTKFGEWLDYWLSVVVLVPLGVLFVGIDLFVVLPPASATTRDLRNPAFAISFLVLAVGMIVVGAFGPKLAEFTFGPKGVGAKMREQATVRELEATETKERERVAEVRRDAWQRAAASLDATLSDANKRLADALAKAIATSNPPAAPPPPLPGDDQPKEVQ